MRFQYLLGAINPEKAEEVGYVDLDVEAVQKAGWTFALADGRWVKATKVSVKRQLEVYLCNKPS